MITEAVQALAGVLLPSATMFLLLLCNDREVLGPWRNRPWLNVLASVIVAMLVLLSLILMATTCSRASTSRSSRFVGGAVLASGCSGSGRSCGGPRRRRRGRRSRPGRGVPSEQWTMPPIALLARPQQSATRRIAMLTMEAYLLLAVALLVVKAIQLGGA